MCRAQAKKEGKSTPLRVPSSKKRKVPWLTDTLVKMQLDDDSLKTYRDRKGVMVKDEKEVSFEVRKEWGTLSHF